MTTASVRVGYKNTELGVIPEDWNVCRFSDHFNIYAGGDVPKHSFSETQSNSFPNPIFANALKDRGLYGYTGETRSKAGSLTITARGYLGHAEYRNVPFFPIVRLLVLEPTGKLDAAFTAYAINDRVVFAIESTGVPQLTAPQVGKYAVAAPPTLSEQRAIAAALSEVDAAIRGLDRLVAKKRDLKQAVMQNLLTGKRRLPGFSGAWGVKRIDEFTDCTAGGTPSSSVPEYWGGGIRWMTSGELNLKYVYEVEGRITDLGLRNSSATMLPKQCVLIGLAGQGKTRGTAAMNMVELCTNQSIAAIFPNNSYSSKYLYYNMDFRYEELRSLSTGGSGRGGLNLKIIKSMLVPFPSIDEQSAIATVLSDMDRELESLEARRDKATALKQGMMQELLTGRTRLLADGGNHDA